MADRTEGLLRSGVREVRTPDAVRDLLSANFPPDQGPYELVEKLRTVGERKARAEGVAYQLEHERSIMLSRLATEFSLAHNKQNLSEAKLERMSRADPRYGEHIKRTAKALEERDLVRSEYWAIKSLLEWDRTSVAHLNALSRLEEPV
jgi:hypothetical protein|tara:strand:+ start:145 stop:588 length:444 start_codon:yes stop_codon:yes gene_type:complete